MLDRTDEAALAAALAPEPAPAPPRPRRDGRGTWRTVGLGLKFVAQVALTLAILVGAGYATMAIVKDRPEPKRRPSFTPVYTIETAQAVRGDHRPVFTAYGEIVAARTVDLRALVAGEIVAVSPNLQAGARVERGEALVSIDDFRYRGAVTEADAGLLEAEARIAENEARIAAERAKQSTMQEQLDLATADVARAERLRRRGQLTQQQLEARQLVVSQRRQTLDLSAETIKIEEARLAQQRAGVERLRWAKSRAERDLASTTLRAPFDGIVRTADAEIGRLVSANDVAVSLYEPNALEARFTLGDARFGRLQTSAEPLTGRAVEVSWTVGGRTTTYPATIVRLGADIASDRGGVEVFARLDLADGAAIRPGAFVEVRVPDATYTDVFALPDTALFGEDRMYVNENGALVERRVEIAAFDEDRVLVSAGLASGDKVLVTRITEVAPGLKVREEGESAPAGEPRRGRPSREEVAAILEANDLSREEWRALPRDERASMVRAHRERKDDAQADGGTGAGE